MQFCPVIKLQMQYIIISFLPQKQVSVLKQIHYNLLHQSLVQSDVIRTSSTSLPKVCHSDWHLCSKHNLASSFTMPNRIEIGPNPRMVATLEKNMGQSKMQMKPNSLPRKQHNKHIQKHRHSPGTEEDHFFTITQADGTEFPSHLLSTRGQLVPY